MTARARPAPLAEVLDAPFRFVKRELRVLAPWAAAMGAIWSTPMLVNQAALSMLGGFGSGGADNPATLIAVSLVSNAAGLLGGALYFVGLLGIYHLVYARLEGRAVDARLLWRAALDWRLWIVGIVEMVINFGSLLLCGLPMLYVLPVLLPSFAVVLHEDEHIGAIKRCFQLVHHSAGGVTAWRTWGRLVALLHVVYFVQSAVTSLTATPVFAVMGWRMWRSLSDGSFTPDMMQTAALLPLWIQAPITLLGGALGGVAMLYPVAARMFMYRDMRDTRDGTDLLEALDAAEGAVA
jgi:hypothetical protein